MEAQGFLPSSQAGSSRAGKVAWDEFVRRFGNRLKLRVRSALLRHGAPATRDAVDDLAQEVYCRLLERHGRGLAECRAVNEPQLLAYLARVVDSAVVDRLRQARAAKRGQALLVSLVSHGSEDLAERCADPRASPEEAALASDGFRRLVARFRRLEGGAGKASRSVDILLLAAVGGWTSREIARVLPGRLAASSVDSLLHRLKGRLRRSWREGAAPG